MDNHSSGDRTETDYRAVLDAHGGTFDLVEFIDIVVEAACVTKPLIFDSELSRGNRRWNILNQRLEYDFPSKNHKPNPQYLAILPSDIEVAEFNAFRKVVWPIFEKLGTGELVARGMPISTGSDVQELISPNFWRYRQWTLLANSIVAWLPYGGDFHVARDEEWEGRWESVVISSAVGEETAKEPPVAGVADTGELISEDYGILSEQEEKSSVRQYGSEDKKDAAIIEIMKAHPCDPKTGKLPSQNKCWGPLNVKFKEDGFIKDRDWFRKFCKRSDVAILFARPGRPKGKRKGGG